MKVCSRCHIEKNLDEFCRHRGNPDGLNYQCKSCVKQYQDRNIEKRKLYDKKRVALLKTRKIIDIKIPLKKKCKKCGLIKPSRDFVRNRCKQDGLDSRCKMCLKIYHINHKQEEKEYRISRRAEMSKRARERRKKDINVRIKESLRSRLYIALKRQYVRKSISTMKLVGCDVDFLKKHLESHFLPGMTWQNYGLNGWWIDHVIPCAHFDLANQNEQEECFSYKNLRPMWKKANLSKNSFYKGKFIRKGSIYG